MSPRFVTIELIGSTWKCILWGAKTEKLAVGHGSGPKAALNNAQGVLTRKSTRV